MLNDDYVNNTKANHYAHLKYAIDEECERRNGVGSAVNFPNTYKWTNEDTNYIPGVGRRMPKWHYLTTANEILAIIGNFPTSGVLEKIRGNMLKFNRIDTDSLNELKAEIIKLHEKYENRGSEEDQNITDASRGKYITGCKNACTGLCWGTCDTACKNTCSGVCGGSCTGDCTDTCGSGCSSTCTGTCFNDCSLYCSYDCSGACGGTCTGCSGSCKGASHDNPKPGSDTNQPDTGSTTNTGSGGSSTSGSTTNTGQP